jgi:phospholipid/cholesterol/gamma-HCH transport system substrate-binding protein
METRAHYVLVGSITLAIVALAMIFSLWLARTQFNQKFWTYDIVFEGPVRGLEAGGEVRFNGIKVGEITELDFNKNTPNQVIARIRIDSKTPVRTSTEASLESVGLTGVNLIQLTAGDLKDPLMPGVRVNRQYPQIKAKRGALADLLSAGKDIAQQTNDAIAAVNAVLTPENVKALSNTINNLQAATAQLAAKEGALGRSAEAAASLRKAADAVERLADSANARMGKIDTVLSNAQTATGAVVDAADTAAYQTLPDIASAARDLRRTAASIDRLAAQVETGQTSLVRGSPPKPTIKVAP